jgi:hypothetical protein
MHTAEESRMATSHSMASLKKKEPDRSPTPAAVRAGIPSNGPGLALNMQRSAPLGLTGCPSGHAKAVSTLPAFPHLAAPPSRARSPEGFQAPHSTVNCLLAPLSNCPLPFKEL